MAVLKCRLLPNNRLLKLRLCGIYLRYYIMRWQFLDGFLAIKIFFSGGLKQVFSRLSLTTVLISTLGTHFDPCWGLPRSVTWALMVVVVVLFPRWQLIFFQLHISFMVLLHIKHILDRGWGPGTQKYWVCKTKEYVRKIAFCSLLPKQDLQFSFFMCFHEKFLQCGFCSLNVN